MSYYTPVLAKNYFALRTEGDGNCLFRACSLAITGSEKWHIALRLFAGIEVALNINCYGDDSLVVLDLILLLFGFAHIHMQVLLLNFKL